jgi:hypothetical protein
MYLKTVVLVLCLSAVYASDEYIAEVREECKNNRDLISCGKLEAITMIKNATIGMPTDKIDGMINIVTMKKEIPETVFSGARQMPGDSEVKKFFKFILRQADAFVGSRSISISLPEEVKIVDAENPDNEIVPGGFEARGHIKKKKAAMLLPIVMLFKLFKIKILVALTFAAVLFIKKAILLFALFAPSYLHMLKICKVPQHGGYVEDHHDVGSSGFGYASHGGGGYHAGGYGKDWANSRAYAAQKPT